MVFLLTVLLGVQRHACGFTDTGNFSFRSQRKGKGQWGDASLSILAQGKEEGKGGGGGGGSSGGEEEGAHWQCTRKKPPGRGVTAT